MKNLILFFIMPLSMSCNKNCELPTQIIGTGEIVSNGLIYQPAITWDMKNQEHIIKADSQNIFNLTVSFDNGNTYETIDFNQYTLLGKYARENCEVMFERNVTKDDIQKNYSYKIKVHQCGTCKTNWESMNWVLVPIIPNDYNVSFTVE
jgi:hypothetical protein